MSAFHPLRTLASLWLDLSDHIGTNPPGPAFSPAFILNVTLGPPFAPALAGPFLWPSAVGATRRSNRFDPMREGTFESGYRSGWESVAGDRAMPDEPTRPPEGELVNYEAGFLYGRADALERGHRPNTDSETGGQRG